MELNELKGSVFSSLELASLRSSVRQDVGGGGGRGEFKTLESSHLLQWRKSTFWQTDEDGQHVSWVILLVSLEEWYILYKMAGYNVR